MQPGRVFAGAYLDQRTSGCRAATRAKPRSRRIDSFLLAVAGGVEHVAVGAGSAHRREPADIDPDVVPDDPIGGVSEGQQPAADVIGYRDERGATRAERGTRVQIVRDGDTWLAEERAVGDRHIQP